MRKATLAILLSLFFSTTAAVRADDAPKGDKRGDKAAPEPAAPRKFLTHHRFTAGGVDIPYTATAEDIDLKDCLNRCHLNGHRRASIISA